MAFLTRAAALAARAWQSQGSTTSRSAFGQNVQQVRAMGVYLRECWCSAVQGVARHLTHPCLDTAGGHAAHGNPSDYVTYAGLTLKKPPTWEYALSKVIGGTMWYVDKPPAAAAAAC